MLNSNSNKCAKGSLKPKMRGKHNINRTSTDDEVKGGKSRVQTEKSVNTAVTSSISKKDNFKCSQCTFETHSLELTKDHLLKHSQSDNFECGECGYITVFKSQFNVHMKIHSRKKRFKCEKCFFSTAHKGYFKIHAAFHAINQSEESPDSKLDNQCNFQSDSNSSLIKHNIHDFKLNDKKDVFKCSECIFVSYSNRGIAKHMFIHKKASKK